MKFSSLLNVLALVAISFLALYLAFIYLEANLFRVFLCLWLALWLTTLNQSIKVSDVSRRRKRAEAQKIEITSKHLPLYGKETGYNWEDVRKNS